MSIVPHTPGDLPSSCPVCGTLIGVEYSSPSGDVACPNCGHLVWLTKDMAAMLEGRIADLLGVSQAALHAATSFAELRADSLDAVELVMELEEEFGISIPDDVAEHTQTLEDLLKHLKRFSHRRED